MVVLPPIALILQGLLMLSNWLGSIWLYGPFVAIMVLISAGLFDWSSKWIEHHSRMNVDDRQGVQG